MKTKGIPPLTLDFIKYLEAKYPDKFELSEKEVGTPEYWKKAGIIELIRDVKNIIKRQGV